MPNENMSDIKEVQKEEAKFFNNIAEIRTKEGHVPMEADIRLATKFIPKKNEHLPLIDPDISKILDGGNIEKYLDLVAHKPGGRVLDICCGSGWLSLELARRGQIVDAYDLSPDAIALAKKTLAKNTFKKGFGSINYHVGDVSEVDLGIEKYDAVSGWAAFHHLPDPSDFIFRANKALKKGGVIATYDDLEMGKFEKFLELLLRFILPQIHYSYLDKISILFELITKKRKLPEEIFSPMEEAKHHSVEDITRIFKQEFKVLYFNQKNAFVGTPVMTMSGNDKFRHGLARVLVCIDRLLCKLRIVKGFDQIIVAKKK
jgi:2-polyprenyl-3-methyl-5-hydroxy-6-metoxy-1,4-benzoquinol methylase